MHMRRQIQRSIGYGLQAVLLIAALVPIFPRVFLHGEVLVPMSHMYEIAPWSAHRPPDLPAQNPLGSEVTLSVCVWYKLTEEAFDSGRIPLWNSLQFMGAPLLGNYQTAIFYPPRLLFRFIDDTYIATTIYFLLRLWLCGFNAFIAARILGMQSPFANLFSFLYMLAGYNLLWTLYPPPDVMAWLPLLFAASEVILNGRYRLGIALMTISATMQILAGHPSSLLFGCIGTALYAAIRLLAARGPMRNVLRCACASTFALALSLAVSAVQLFPFIEYMPEMALFINLFYPEGVAHYTYSAYDLLSLWGPRILGTEHEVTFWGSTNHTYLAMLYPGIVTWVGLALLLSLPKLSRPDRVRFAALLIPSAILTYLATDLPYANFVQKLPILNGSRPAYFIAFTAFALPYCGVYALRLWMDRRPGVRSLVRPSMALGAVAIGIAGALAAAPYLSFDYIALRDKGIPIDHYAAVQWAVAAAVTVGGMLLLILCAVNLARAKTMVVALCFLAVIDQAVGIHGLFATTPRRDVVPATAITDYLRAQPAPTRVRFDTTRAKLGYPALYGIEEFGGYDAVYPKRMRDFYDNLNLAPGGTGDMLLSCDFTLFLENTALPEGYDKVVSREGITIAKNMRSLPRARLVGSVVSIASSERLFDALKKPDFDPRAVVYTDEKVEFSLPQADATPPGTAEITHWGADYVSIVANAQKPCALVLADGYYPGWDATVDGSPTKIFPAYHLFRGVYVPAGTHTVEFCYRPASFRNGLIVSLAALIISGISAIICLRQQRRRFAAPALHA